MPTTEEITRRGSDITIVRAGGRFAARSNEDRFWERVNKTPTCWLWTAGVDKDGYGKFAVTLPAGSERKQRHVRAHRYSWELANDRGFPFGLVSLHSCDNPACVRPDHVSPGTQAENRADCGRKGRDATGDRNGNSLSARARRRGEAL